MSELSIVYYTNNVVDKTLSSQVQRQFLAFAVDKPVVAVIQKDEDIFNRFIKYPNITTVNTKRFGSSHLKMYQQIHVGAKKAQTPYVGLAEHDCFYTEEHFDFIPPSNNVFYYNTNHWFVTWLDKGKGKHDGMYSKPYKDRCALSNLICDRKLLIKALEKRIQFLKDGGKIIRGVWGASEFGVRDDDYQSATFSTNLPNLDVRHGNNFSGFRKGKHRTFFLKPYGSFHALMGIKPPGRWYQEATINGKEMPFRRRSDTNEKRWNKFIRPILPFVGSDRTFVDLGCNAGFYCRKMADLGFKTIGVEREAMFLRHGAYWETLDPKGVKLVKDDVNDYQLPSNHLTLLANVHYWLTLDQFTKLIEKFAQKSLYVIVIGRYKTLERHHSSCDEATLRGNFESWEAGEIVYGSKHFSIIFKNPQLLEKNVEDLSFFQQFMKSKRFLPAYNQLIDLVLSGKDFDPLKTDYYAYLTWRGFKNKDELLARHIDLVGDIKENGIREPLEIGRTIKGVYEENRLVDGDHRLIVAMGLGLKSVVCKRVNKVKDEKEMEV